MRRLLAFALSTTLLTTAIGCAPRCCKGAPVGSVAAAPAPIDRLADAFNRADVETLLATTHPDVEWMFIQGDQIIVRSSARASILGFR